MERQTYHIHITGIVQGVGFRPFIYTLAKRYGLFGYVNNSYDGVHIEINASREEVKKFTSSIQSERPSIAEIKSLEYNKVDFTVYDDFKIVESDHSKKVDLYLTPDYASCEYCLKESEKDGGRRENYGFTACTYCGPRYSIIHKLPYDRPFTSMADFPLCNSCQKEFDDPLDRRFHFQTNSCETCGVQYEVGGRNSESSEEIYTTIISAWQAGKIVAIKGIGGYLLTCDASNQSTVIRLRSLKNRPSKPFALMYPNIELVEEECDLSEKEKEELLSLSAPIVLLKAKYKSQVIAFQEIAPNLDRIGVMLPYTPLYHLLLKEYGKPIVATSGNKSGSAICYENTSANEELKDLADLIIGNDRDIVVPQDDSVIAFTSNVQKKIVLRRARGLAPTFLNVDHLKLPHETILCMGAEMKGAFTLLHNRKVYISQYLGSLEDFQAQENYRHVLNHLLKVFEVQPTKIVVDMHPAYFSTQLGRELQEKWNAELLVCQHHKAHLLSVLAENELLNKNEVLGFVWDGLGLGDDQNIWGGEVFSWNGNEVKWQESIGTFRNILGDKQAKEPRISAFAISEGDQELQCYFNEVEWKLYHKILEKETLISSSVGRLFDAAACIVIGIEKQSYEGEAAILLEQYARSYFEKHHSINCEIAVDEFISDFPKMILQELIKLKTSKSTKEELAAYFHCALVKLIIHYMNKYAIKDVVFSGGVFQNGCLVDLLHSEVPKKYNIYFHNELSPNDENISFGQLISIL